jgi:hypothetical protein
MLQHILRNAALAPIDKSTLPVIKIIAYATVKLPTVGICLNKFDKFAAPRKSGLNTEMHSKDN